MFHIQLLNTVTNHHCTQHVQQSVDMSIQLPAGLQCDPVQMPEVVEQEYVLVGVMGGSPGELSEVIVT